MTRSSLGPDRDLALVGLLTAALAVLFATAAVLMLGAASVTALHGGTWRMPAVDTWASHALVVLAHPNRPGQAFSPPWAAQVAAHPTQYWTLTLLTLAAASTTMTAIVRPTWHRFGPSTPGHASREEIRAELSPAAARATAEWTRPSLTAAERARVPVDEVAAPLHQGPHHEILVTPLENPTGTLAPTQSGKSRKDLVHKVLAAPGALLCSTTKADLLEFTALARTRRPGAGPVLLYDATGTVAWPAQLRWSPIAGCADSGVARRRAHTMVEAAAVELTSVGGNDKVFRDRAKTVMQAYLLAAGLHRRDVTALVRWATGKPLDQEPVKLLAESGYLDLARNLRTEIGMVAETSDAVWMSVRRCIEPLMDPKLRQLCLPRPGEELDARDFISRRGSLYLIAGQHQAAMAAPLLTALVEYWLTTAQEMAMAYPYRRVDPPVTTVLDELTQASPVPQLPGIIADSAGRGVLIHWAAQSLAALEDTYGPERARQLLDNTTTLSVWGGLKDQRTLEWVSLLAGHHDRPRYQHQQDGLLGSGRSAVSTETVPTFRPGEIRTVPRGRVLVIHRHLRPVLARTVDVKHRPGWPSLRADVQTIRNGTAPVDAAGNALSDEGTTDGR
jgi:type IV secretory pathway TraG/TraD family ATPase VirD4